MFDNQVRYGAISRFLHWGMALLLLWQFASVGARSLMEDSAIDEFLWATHKPLGTLLLGFILLRIVWALVNRHRRPASVSLAAKLGHIALYVLLFTVPALGLLRQYGSGRVFEPFGLTLFSGFDEKISWMVEPGNLLHGSLGWTLITLVVGHIVMAFWHRKRKGNVDVIPRMWR